MGLVLVFAFAGGALTILSPCTLPVIPFVLGTLGGTARGRAAGVMAGFAGSFTATAVLLAAAFGGLGISTQPLRVGSALLLGLFGLAVAVPAASRWFESRTTRLASCGARLTAQCSSGFLGGLILGAVIGLVWAPCVGPIMGAVIATAVVAGPTGGAIAVSLAYVAGAATGLVVVATLGRQTIRAIGGPRAMAGAERMFGLSMVAAALAVITGLDLVLGQGLAGVLPGDVARAIVVLEERPEIEKELTVIRPSTTGQQDVGSAMPQVAAPEPGQLPSAIAAALPASVPLDDLGVAPEVRGITAWINSDPLGLAALRGKVVLVHFWTFGCINCIHVQPYVKAWYDRYAAAGFVVLGVHTPELSFERDIDNVRKAVADASVHFPVAFDPSYATWQAYGNHYWPAFYFVDRAGHIRHVHFGEGDYERSEQVIRQLLAMPG